MSVSVDLGRSLGASGVRTIDHVAVAVRDLSRALELFGGVLGGTFITGGDNDETGIRIVHLALGGFKVELMSPLREDSLLARTMETRGEGLHHVTFMVDNVEAATVAARDAGFHTTEPLTDSLNWQEVFVRPTSAGALVQYVKSPRDWSAPVDGITVDDVLAGRAVFRDSVPCLRDASTT